jgi:hypothetical protein
MTRTSRPPRTSWCRSYKPLFFVSDGKARRLVHRHSASSSVVFKVFFIGLARKKLAGVKRSSLFWPSAGDGEKEIIPFSIGGRLVASHRKSKVRFNIFGWTNRGSWLTRNWQNFVQMGFSLSNWQKVQLNTDLFSDTRHYLFTQKRLD